VYLDFKDAIARIGVAKVKEKYGNLFDMYHHITDENPYEQPMRIYPAVHYTMGGLWVDYNLMTTIPGLFCLGEANFSDHGANRLGASALMQGLADGYFVLPYTIGGYLAGSKLPKVTTDHPAFAEAEGSVNARTKALLGANGKKAPSVLHRELGHVMWDKVGMGRNAKGLNEALAKIPEIRAEFWKNVAVTGSGEDFNQTLERAGRVADFLEFGELLAKDALTREESCGGHFREEHQTPDGEAKRDDANFSHVAAWEYKGEGKPAERHTEPLTFDNVHIAQRNYA
jgi:succinate dehydrogenase / fumarate reductase flavoprotein subunit